MEIFISMIVGITVFLIVVAIVIAVTPNTIRLEDRKETYSSNIHSKLFKGDPDKVAQKMGIATDKYIFNCNMLGIEPKIALIVLSRIISIAVFVIGVAAGILLKSYVVIAITAIVAMFAVLAPTASVQSKANERRANLEKELPRFLDLFQTALKIQIPVATAIEITAKSVDGILSEELLKALAKSEMGANRWQDALYSIAQKYEVDTFSDFVMDIVTAFDKGTNITASVERQSRDLKQTSLLHAKENASKVTSTILFPITIFKMLPLMAILFAPIVMQLIGGF